VESDQRNHPGENGRRRHPRFKVNGPLLIGVSEKIRISMHGISPT
jgi:hypothetical protein